MLFFLVRQHLEDGFWKGEIASLLVMFGHSAGLDDADFSFFPFVEIKCTKAQAILAGSRSIMVKRVLEVFAKGETCEQLKVGFQLAQSRPNVANPSIVGSKKDNNFPEKQLMDALIDLPTSHEMRLILHTFPNNKPTVGFGSKILAEGCSELVTHYQLKNRNLLGPTSLSSELSFLMANLVLADSKSLLMDPYFGTGGAVIGAVHFKAKVIGVEIDWRMLEQGKPFETFKQYSSSHLNHLCFPDVIRGDFSRGGRCLRLGCKLDGIIADPPYGIRAGARKTGENGKTILQEHLSTHIPQTQKYEGHEVMQDLLDAANDMLKVGGRLVYLYPIESNVWFGDNGKEHALPKHTGLKLLHFAHDQMRLGMSRILVTMEKIEDDHLKRLKSE